MRTSKEKTEMKKKIMTIMIAALVIGSVSLFAITNQEAENIALESAGVDRNSITNIFSRIDREDGVRVYDVTFFDADGKYEYSIGADDGLVYGFDYEKNMRRVSTPSSSPVSRDEALSIALVEADLTQADISRERVEYDRDDGMEIYEVEFRSGDYEYSYDIDASNGRVMAGEYEIRGRVASNRNAELISTTEAEMIVRSLIDSNADYVRIRSDYDDGIYIYEADMYAQGIDYEVELNAATGDVIKFSWEDWSGR